MTDHDLKKQLVEIKDTLVVINQRQIEIRTVLLGVKGDEKGGLCGKVDDHEKRIRKSESTLGQLLATVGIVSTIITVLATSIIKFFFDK